MLDYIDQFTYDILLFTHLLILMIALVWGSGKFWVWFIKQVFDIKSKYD